MRTRIPIPFRVDQTCVERVRVRRSSSKSSRFLFEFEFELKNNLFEFEKISVRRKSGDDLQSPFEILKSTARVHVEKLQYATGKNLRT